jgi:hypothetical protein
MAGWMNAEVISQVLDILAFLLVTPEFMEKEHFCRFIIILVSQLHGCQCFSLAVSWVTYFLFSS